MDAQKAWLAVCVGTTQPSRGIPARFKKWLFGFQEVTLPYFAALVRVARR